MQEINFIFFFTTICFTLIYIYIYETNKGGLRISGKGRVGLKGNMNNERLVAF
jgi:hypothetical protein